MGVIGKQFFRRGVLFFALPLLLIVSCAYFNTFYSANRYYKDAERERKNTNGIVTQTARTNYTKALQWSGKLIEQHEGSRYVDDSMFIIGMSYYYTDQFVLARNAFESLERSYPNSEFIPEARLFKAKSLIGLNQFNEATIILSELVNSDDESAKEQATLSIAEIRYLAEEWEELLIAADVVIENDPSEKVLIQAYLYKGEAFFYLERYDNAIEVLKKLQGLGLTPELQVKANSFIAESLAKKGDYDAALATLRTMENKGEFVPFDPRIRLYMGIIHELRGDDETAITTYKNMAGDFPDSAAAGEAWYRVGILLLKDISNADQAKEAFSNVKKPRVPTSETWSVDSQLKVAQIDTMIARLDFIDKLADDSLRQAAVRFSLAELYTYSLDHPDSAVTQYKAILDTATDSEFAVMSDFYLRLYELESAENLTVQTERELMMEIIEKYPKHEFSSNLRSYLGIPNNAPDYLILKKAEGLKYSGALPDEYIPVYEEVVEKYPETRSAYLARLVLAYSYEHDLNDLETALGMYKALADEEQTYFSREFIQKAREKLAYYAQEPELLAEIKKYIADFESGRSSLAESTQETVLNEPAETELTGYKKIRMRNARIRSRYFTN